MIYFFMHLVCYSMLLWIVHSAHKRNRRLADGYLAALKELNELKGGKHRDRLAAEGRAWLDEVAKRRAEADGLRQGS